MAEEQTGTSVEKIVPGAVQAITAMEADNSMMNMIAKAATDPNYDMVKFERLIELRNQELARMQKLAFDEDFVKMKPHLPRVIKHHDNTQTKSKYAKLEDVNEVIDPILGQFGFGTSSKVIGQTDLTVTMRLEVRHRSGWYDVMELTMPVDDKGMAGSVNKTKQHGISSTITYIKRVGFCALLNISTGDDKDGNPPPKPVDEETVSVEQAAEIDNRLRALGPDALPRFLKATKIEKILDLKKHNFEAALKKIELTEKEAKKAVKK